MTDQRAVLKLLNDNPVIETAAWIAGEPSVQDILRDPVVHAVLRRDGLSPHDLLRAIVRGRRRLVPAARSVAPPAGPPAAPPEIAVGSAARLSPAGDAAA